MTNPFANVGIHVYANSQDIFLSLAERLKAEHGSRIHLYVRTPQEFEAWNRPDPRWDSVTDISVLTRLLDERQLDAARVIERAQELEKRLGVSINQLTFSHRQLGRGYSLGSPNFPRAPFFENVSYEQMLRAYSEQIDFWFRQVSDRNLTLLLQGDNISAAVCRAAGIEFRFLIGTTYQDYYMWAADEFRTNPLFTRAYQKAAPDPALDITSPYLASQRKTKDFRDRLGVGEVIRATAIAAARRIYWRIRGYQKDLSTGAFAFIAAPLRRRREFLKLQKFATTTLADLKDKPFVYLPLHKEPEAAFHCRTPEYFYQHALIAAVSRDLPAGVRLAVKENFGAIGWRSSEFYQQLADLKNVVLLRPDESSIDAIKSARATVTIIGTAGLEAAVLGKPVVTFGLHQMISVLPHVLTVRNSTDLRECLARALRDGDPGPARRDGTRLLAAIVSSSFRLPDFAFEAQSGRPLAPEWTETAYTWLRQSVAPTYEARSVVL